MAITNYLVHFTTEATYNGKKSELRNDAVAFVKDATIIHTHGTDYYCGSGPVALKSDLSGYATTSALTSGLAGKANTSHTHTIAQVSGLQSELDSKLESADLSGYALKTDIPSLSGGASATSGQYVSGVTVSGHKVTVIKAALPVVTLASLGVTATATELNYVDGVTSNIQTQLNGKQATITGGASSIVTNNLTESRALVSDASGKVTVSPITSTELGYLDGVTSSIQTQLNNKVSLVNGVLTLSGNSSTGNAIDLSSEEVQDLNIISSHGNNIVLKTDTSSLSVTHSGIQIGAVGRSDALCLNATGKTKQIYANDSTNIQISSGVNFLTIPNNSNGDDATWNDAVILTEDNYSKYITSGDNVYYIDCSSFSSSPSSDVSAISNALGGFQNFLDAVKAGKIICDRTNNFEESIPKGANIVYNITSALADPTWTFTLTGVINGRWVILEISFDKLFTIASIKRTLIERDGVSASNTSSKSFLVGVDKQSDSAKSYSNVNVYMQSGQLYATQMNATNGFFETSDARLKNFKDDIKALDVVSEIPTKYFTWKKDEVAENIDPVLHIGTSAQEVQKIYPDLVTENEKGELSVDYARLSVIALAAIKELKTEIDKLKINK